MYNYDDLLLYLGEEKNTSSLFCIKSVISALKRTGQVSIYKQKINVNIEILKDIWTIITDLQKIFDYQFNTKKEHSDFIMNLLTNSQSPLNIFAIFCPGYTEGGYKDHIGSNNCNRLKQLLELKNILKNHNISCIFHIVLADIFLENTDSNKNPLWKNELNTHIQLFREKALEFFSEEEITLLSNVFLDEKYVCGFVEEKYLKAKTYETFYRNNEAFYQEMGWNNLDIKYRIDKLYTIYSIVAKYINSFNNGIYVPTEKMYSRSKVFSENNTCTMYLKK